MAWAFDHYLHVVVPGNLGELAQGFEFANWASSLASARQPGRSRHPARSSRHILEDLADVLEAVVQEILLMVVRHPLGQDRATAADDASDAVCDQRQVLDQTPAWIVM